MRRREFITFIGSATVWPVAVRAQESIRLGFVPPIVRQTPAVVAFFEELSFNGFAQRTSDGSTCRHTYYDISATSGAPRRDAAARDRANAVCHRQTRGDRKRKQR